MLGKAPPLHGGEPFSDLIDLTDLRTGTQQLLGQFLQLLQRKKRLLQQSRAAAGKE